MILESGRFVLNKTLPVLVRLGFVFRPLERAAIACLRQREGRLRRALWWRYRARLIQAAGANDMGLRVVRICHEVSLEVQIADLIGQIYIDGTPYEPATTSLLETELRQGETFVDVGANFGYFTVLAASRVGPNGRVAAFEANASLQRQLKRSLRMNGFEQRVFCADCALGDEDGKDVDLFVSTDPTQSGISTLVPWRGHVAEGNLSPDRTDRITLRTFDAWRDEYGFPAPDVVKIDVEGAELMVLNGMKKLLDEDPPRLIVCETGLHGRISEWLQPYGYSASLVETYDKDRAWGNVAYRRAPACEPAP